MTLFILQSGDNNSFKQSVDNAGRAYTRAITQSFEENAVENGDAYNLNTGTINIAGTASAVSYVKNNENQPLVITSFIYLFGNSTDGAASEDSTIDVIENPTGGTLISSGSDGTPKNRNVGRQSKTLDVTWKIGSAGSTVTGGSNLISSLFSSSSGRQIVAVKIALPKGSSIAIKYTPQASNTSQNMQFAMSTYKDVYNI